MYFYFVPSWIEKKKKNGSAVLRKTNTFLQNVYVEKTLFCSCSKLSCSFKLILQLFENKMCRGLRPLFCRLWAIFCAKFRNACKDWSHWKLLHGPNGYWDCILPTHTKRPLWKQSRGSKNGMLLNTIISLSKHTHNEDI